MTPLARGSRPMITAPGESRKVPKAAAKSMTCDAVRPSPTIPRRPTCDMRSDFIVGQADSLPLGQGMALPYFISLNRPKASGTWYDAAFVGCHAIRLRAG